MLLIGGRSGDNDIYQNSIWRLGAVSGTWTEDVALQKVSLYNRDKILLIIYKYL